MLFSSPLYLVFLLLVFLLFVRVPQRWRWLVLLLASYVFYGFLLKPELLIALTLVTILCFWLGKQIPRTSSPTHRQLLFWTGTMFSVGVIVFFKYLAFIFMNLAAIDRWLGFTYTFNLPPLLASIGVSFFTFQAISYLADVYFGTVEAEAHLGYFALYLSFFPKLLQGPIERAGDLLPQIKQSYRFDYDRTRSGLLLFTQGMFKKVVVADRLALLANPVFDHAGSFVPVPILIACYAFTLQLYFDFSGYTDMARGAGRLFGLELSDNFNSPFLATSVADYWRRWHISFSKWILDYLFQPIQISLRNFGKIGNVVALLVTFLLVGIWHGANWTFVAFGLIHGVYLSVGFLALPFKRKLYKRMGITKNAWLKIGQIVFTFQLVTLANVFFRANSLHDAWRVLVSLSRGLISGSLFLAPWGNSLPSQIAPFNLPAEQLVILALSLSALALIRWRLVRISALPFAVRFALYFAAIFTIFFCQVRSSTFMYFKF
jgi:D-alanyl-lipoteichoic acid acyltransferase DltB (MBOAT superfamily)